MEKIEKSQQKGTGAYRMDIGAITYRDLESYLLERGGRYGFTNLVRALRTSEFTADYISLFEGESVIVEIKKTIGPDHVRKLSDLRLRTGRDVHVWTLSAGDDVVALIDRLEGIHVHTPDRGDIDDWIRSRLNAGGKERGKAPITGELYDCVSYLERKELSIITPEMVREFLRPGEEGHSSEEELFKRASRLVHQLSEKDWLERITQRRYLLIPQRADSTFWSEHPLVVASNIVKPSFVTAGAALNFHGLLDQVFFHIVVATRTRHSPVDFQGITYSFVEVSEDRFFGYSEVGKGPQPIVVAHPERALVDILDRLPFLSDVQDPVSPFYLAAEDIDLDRLVEYALRLGSHAAIRRLGYLLESFDEVVGLEALKARHLERLENGVGKYRNLTPFGARLPEEGVDIRKWRILDNVDLKNEIRARVEG
jgi:predicted transcriptional regulator of viral defense system